MLNHDTILKKYGSPNLYWILYFKYPHVRALIIYGHDLNIEALNSCTQ